MKGNFKEIKLSVFPITERGYLLAGRLSKSFKKAAIFHPAELKEGGLKKKVKEAFKNSGALLFIGASGIAVRSIAPLIKAKHIDPAVIVMDEGASFVVSLLSGHLGGANRLTKILASIYGAAPVITTATDVMGLPCAEDIVGRFSLAVEDPAKIKKINSAILRGEKVLVADRNARRRREIKRLWGGIFDVRARLPKEAPDGPAIYVGSVNLHGCLKDSTLILRPKDIVIGIGCRRGVSASEIDSAIRTTLEEKGLSPLSIKNLASIDVKKDEAGLLRFAKAKKLEIDFYSAEKLKTIKAPSKGSRIVLEAVGVAAVSEPAALLSAGTKRLCIRKKKIGRITVAAALAPFLS